MLALAECIQEWAERAEVEPVCPHADQVRRHAIQFADQDADDVRLLRDLHATELLDGERVAEIHVHPGQIIHSVRVRDVLNRQHILADLLGTTV